MILFVDDDTRYIKDYVEELHGLGYAAEQQCNIDKALDWTISNTGDIDLLVLDMMIPSGDRLEDKDNGRRTGYLFLREVRSCIGDISFPFIIFTHVAVERLSLEEFKSSYEVIQKENYTPFQLAQRIEELFPQIKQKKKAVD